MTHQPTDREIRSQVRAILPWFVVLVLTVASYAFEIVARLAQQFGAPH